MCAILRFDTAKLIIAWSDFARCPLPKHDYFQRLPNRFSCGLSRLSSSKLIIYLRIRTIILDAIPTINCIIKKKDQIVDLLWLNYIWHFANHWKTLKGWKRVWTLQGSKIDIRVFRVAIISLCGNMRNTLFRLNLLHNKIVAGIWNCNLTFSSLKLLVSRAILYAFSKSRICCLCLLQNKTMNKRRWWTYARCVTDYFPRDCAHLNNARLYSAFQLYRTIILLSCKL